MTDSPCRIDWLAAALYPLAVVLMEACWVTPWLAWVGGWGSFREPRPALGFISVTVTLAFSLLLTRLLLRGQWPLRRVQAATIGAGLVVILLVLGLEYRDGYTFLNGDWFAYLGRLLADTLKQPSTAAPAILALLYLWWRGITLGQATANFRSIYRAFLFGLAAIVALLALWRLGGASAGPGPGVGFYVMGFFFFGLLAIAVNHLYVMRRSMPREEAALTSPRRWLPVMLGVIGGMVLLGFLAAGVLSPELFATVGRGASAFFDFIGTVLNYILLPFSFLFEAIFWLLRLIAAWLRQEPLQPPEGPNEGGFPEMTPATLRDLPAWLAASLQWLLIALLAAVVVFVLARAISRWRDRAERDEIEEVNESLFTWRGLGDDLRQMLKAMGDRFKRRPQPAPAAYIDDDSRRLDVREVYRRLLREADLAGLPRRRPETPAEYARRLRKMVPEGDPPVSVLTDLYSRVRYGETAVAEEQIDGANTLWKALREVLRKLNP